MTVRQFLNAYNIGRSTACCVTVFDVSNMECKVYLSKGDIKNAVYGGCGQMKLNSFDVINNEIKIYAENV